MEQALLAQRTAIVPDRLVSTSESGQEWFASWMAAREEVRQERPVAALNLYKWLLSQRPELLEARWEYVQLLLVLERHEAAGENLEILLDRNPDNLFYQQAQGVLLLSTGKTRRGVVYLARVWAADNERFDVGMNLYKAYMTLGEKVKALPVLEGLHRKKSDDVSLQKALFHLYVEQGNDQQAQALGASLANSEEASFDLILLVAQVHDRLGLTHLAAEYWQKLIVFRPDYSPAHAHLGEYYSAQGREAEALPHLLHGYSKDPNNNILAGRIGAIYADSHKYAKAISFLEQYLREFPDHIQENLLLAQSYKATGDVNKSARFFDLYLRLEKNPPADIRLQAAEVFTDTGDKKKAVDQYQSLVTGEGGNEKYLVNLAKNLTATGQYNQALAEWQKIAASQPEDIASRLEMVSLYEILGRRADMVAMLEEIHSIDANNHLVTLKLAEFYFLQGNSSKGWQLFEPLMALEFFSPEFLAVRARIYYFLGLPEHAFKDMAEVVGKDDASDRNRLDFLDIAGSLGRLDVVREQADLLADKALFLLPAGRLVYARALARSGELIKAQNLYKGLLSEGTLEVQVQARLDMAEVYRLYGFLNEAEQAYRIAWLEGHDLQALFGLVDINLVLGNIREAEAWFDIIPTDSKKYRCQRSLYEIRILNDLEEYEDALFLAKELLSSSAAVCSSEQRVEVDVLLAAAYLGEGDDDISLSTLSALVASGTKHTHVYTQIVRLHEEMGEETKVKEAIAQALEFADSDLGLLSDLMEVSLTDHLYQMASASGRSLRDKASLSLGFLLRYIRILELNGEFDEADSVVNNLLATYPENGLLNLFGARLALSLGNYEKGLVMIEKALAFNDKWYDALLLKARLNWALFHWQEAFAVYAQALTPMAEQAFLDQCAAKKLELPPYEEVSMWMKVIQPMGRPSPLQRSLGADFAMNSNYKSVARQAADFYADYRWQITINRELAARKSVQRREYHRAVKQYGGLLRDEDDPTLLFDLAGLYSSLDRVGDEGMIYRRLQDFNPDFPGLIEAMNRNHLKRRPQTGFYFKHGEKTGRKGYYDLASDDYGTSVWFSPSPQKEIKVSAARIHYESPTSHNSRYANKADLLLASNFYDYLQFQATVGGQALSGDNASVGVFDFSVTGLAGDRFESYIGIKRQVVTDTLASVERLLMAHIYEASAELDLMPRLQAGGELGRTEYSDDNVINGYSIWLSSVFLPEPHFLKATIFYEFLDAQEKNEAVGVLLDDGFTTDDHPYWSPEHYWRNHFVIDYKHKFSDDVLGRSTPSYLTAGYSFSYDVNEDTAQVFRAGINVEISKSWLLKIDSSFEESDKYRTRDLLGTLLYRW
ncbi:MAG: tetratricopeptide repeat protein [Thermodesulfobacteriota bacterium]